ncbi:MAG TPA: TIGR04282 family arsenosugar biosynthesis glycosyltransferase [Nitrospirales bacterium]|nr:TIGR04282 family arsenosugar biosynthesis glycosyltransferase [Nitrospirales bacterium]
MSAKSAPATRRPTGALVLFAKAPVPGQVKTRLTPPLTPDETASLHGSFVLDALERTAGLKAVLDRFVACAPSAEHVFFKILGERHGVRLLDQRGPEVGARMAAAFDDLFRQGYERVVLAGTDLPTLPVTAYHQTLDLLAGHDVVLGPAVDGGYYLIALKRSHPELFREMPWSTPDVRKLTEDRAKMAGLTVGLLPAHRDIDTIDDLRAVIAEYRLAEKGKGQASVNLSKRTEGALRLLAGRYPELRA